MQPKNKNTKHNQCAHLQQWNEIIKPRAQECEACVKTGSQWVHLRTCQTCGVTLCCDSSENRHATKHYQDTGHPLIISAEPGEQWVWCYEHQQILPY